MTSIIIGFSEYLVLPVHVKEAPFTAKKISQGWGWGNGGGKATAVMPRGGGGGGLSLIGALVTSPSRASLIPHLYTFSI